VERIVREHFSARPPRPWPTVGVACHFWLLLFCPERCCGGDLHRCFGVKGRCFRAERVVAQRISQLKKQVVLDPTYRTTLSPGPARLSPLTLRSVRGPRRSARRGVPCARRVPGHANVTAARHHPARHHPARHHRSAPSRDSPHQPRSCVITGARNPPTCGVLQVPLRHESAGLSALIRAVKLPPTSRVLGPSTRTS
jgi:hypothetical protein